MARAVAGLHWKLHDWDEHVVKLGVGGLGMTCAQNQSNFTFGQGGYFSPEWFVRGSRRRIRAGGSQE